MPELKLTHEQQKAINSLNGIICLSAGPGCGKTFVLVNRYFAIVQYLVGHGYSLEQSLSRIMAVTFTNKASFEMKERISEKLLGFEYNGIKVEITDIERLAQNMRISTIDSWASSFLRDHAFEIGFDPDFSLLDPALALKEFEALSEKIFNEYNVCELYLDQRPRSFLKDIYRFIEYLKCRLIGAEEFLDITKKVSEIDNTDIYNIAKFIAQVYQEFNAHLASKNYFTFSDLLMTTHEIFQKHPNIFEMYSRDIDYILIDEYQDINDAQDRALRILSQKAKKEHKENYFIVGDIGQSIYGFRNANYRNMLNYKNEYSDISLDLSTNFRSTQTIVDFANRFFSETSDHFQYLQYLEQKPTGDNIDLLISKSRDQESSKIALKVKQLLNTQYKPGDIKILFRQMTDIWKYAGSLNELEIPFVIIGSSEFGRRKEVLDFLALFRILADPFDDIAAVRLLGAEIFGFSYEELSVLKNRSKEIRNLGFLDVLQDALNDSDFCEQSKYKISRYIDFNNRFLRLAVEEKLSFLFVYMLEDIGYLEYIRTLERIDYLRYLDSLEKFKFLIRKYEDENLFGATNGFLEYFQDLKQEGFSVFTNENINDFNAVVLMSIHQSKGLEFPVSIVAGVTKTNNKQPKFHFCKHRGLIIRDASKKSIYGKFLKPNLDEEFEREEERIFYVGATRAKEKLIISGIPFKGKFSEFINRIVEMKHDEVKVKENFRDILRVEEFDNKLLQDSEKVSKKLDKPILDLTKLGEEIEKNVKFYDDVHIDLQEKIENFYSVSNLESYKTCPYSYYLRKVLDF
ncbi:UvrD-helicase domain-containing protein, partial [bacterium]